MLKLVIKENLKIISLLYFLIPDKKQKVHDIIILSTFYKSLTMFKPGAKNQKVRCPKLKVNVTFFFFLIGF